MSKMTPTEKALTRRYLVWCYKTTKEELDRIDRYFTQLKVDARVLAQLLKEKKIKDKDLKTQYLKKVNDFKQYMKAKEQRVLAQKYTNVPRKTLQPDYLYLKNRLAAIEETARQLLGAKDLAAIRSLYEEEMTKRILEAREHT